MKKKPPARKKLGIGNRVNPWRSVAPSHADLLVAAMTANCIAHRALVNVARLEGTPGICQGCGCTDEAGCTPPCRWIDARHTRCSSCSEEPRSARSRRRPLR